MKKRIYYNYSSILKNLVQYIPSRIVIILNSFLIIPIFTRLLNTKEISIYLISLQVLNILCTCTFDLISKAVLRFYEKYSIQNKISEFFSTTVWISVFVYGIILFLSLVSRKFIVSQFALNNTIFWLTILLIIPCAIRQFLYQILRLHNSYKLYTISIVLYQLVLISVFLMLFNVFPQASAIIIAMIISITIIDIIIIRRIHFNYPIILSFDKEIALETLRYSLPLVITNFCYWAIYNVPKLLFQSFNQFLNTALIGISWTLSLNIVAPLANLFIFVNFPVIVKIFEHKKSIKPYFTNLIQLYLFILVPITCGICFYSTDIVKSILPDKYDAVAILLPIFVFSCFLHELMKLINLKYHIKNSTYLETLPGIVVTIISAVLYWFAVQRESVLFAALICLGIDLILLVTNLYFKYRSFNYINYSKVFKTLIPLILINLFCFFWVNVIFMQVSLTIIKPLFYLVCTYCVSYLLRNKILQYS